jgi:hypothetical protein
LWGNNVTTGEESTLQAGTIAKADEKTKRYYLFVNATVRNDKTGRDDEVVVKEAERTHKSLVAAGKLDEIT